MSDKYSTQGSALVGTNLTIINLFNPLATPTKRGRIYDIIIGCAATPADHASNLTLGRTTAVGTEGSGLVPAPLDPGAPVGEYDSGLGVFGAEPTYTAAKTLLAIPMNQRATFRWVASPGSEIVLAATQNNGAGLKSLAATGAASHTACILFEE